MITGQRCDCDQPANRPEPMQLCPDLAHMKAESVRQTRGPTFLSPPPTPSGFPAPSGGHTFSAKLSALPFVGQTYFATTEQIANTMRGGVGTLHQAKRIGTKGWSDHASEKCHIQGLAVTADRFITSCMTKSSREGYLQIYPVGPGKPLTQYQDAKSGAMLVHFLSPPHGHSVVGQGVVATRLPDGNGGTVAPPISFLAPVVSSYTSPAGNPQMCPGKPRIDLIDQWGNKVFSFCHEAADDDEGKHDLSCATLTVWNGRLYLIAIRHQFLYVYLINWQGPADTTAKISAQRVLHQRLAPEDEIAFNLGGVPVGWPGQPGYASVNAFVNHQNRVFIVCGHDRWLDTWELRLGGPQDKRVIKLGKIEKDLGAKDLFFEGAAITQTSSTSLIVYATPWDYRRTYCLGAHASEKCTHLWSFERAFS